MVLTWRVVDERFGTTFVLGNLDCVFVHIYVPDLAPPSLLQFEPRGAMVATVNIELPPVDACGVRTVTNPFAPGVTMVAGDLKSRAHRLGLRKTSQIRCPVTGLVLEPRGNDVRVNLDKQAQAYLALEEGVRRSRSSRSVVRGGCGGANEREARPARAAARRRSVRNGDGLARTTASPAKRERYETRVLLMIVLRTAS